MMTDEQAYTLHIIKKAITSYLDENVPNTEKGLNILLSQCDDLVWKIASNIYTQSGYKAEFYVIRDVINTRIEPLKVHIANMKAEEARKLAEQARLKELRRQEEAIKLVEQARLKELQRQEEAIKLVEQARLKELQRQEYAVIKLAEEAKRKEEKEARRLEEETQRKQREETIKLEEEAKKIAEEAYYSELKKQLKESGRDEKLCDIFSKVQYIVSEQSEIELDHINLDSNLKDDLALDCLDCSELIMALEAHFEIEITDDLLVEVNIIIQPSFSWWSLSSGDIDDTHYFRDCTIGKLVDLIHKIIEQEN